MRFVSFAGVLCLLQLMSVHIAPLPPIGAPSGAVAAGALAGWLPAEIAMGPKSDSCVPAIFNFSEAVKPGDLIRINGGDIEQRGLKIMALNNPGVPAAEPPAAARELDIIVSDADGLYVVTQLPKDARPGIYDIWVRNEHGWSRPIKVNGPRLCWVSEDESAAGLKVTLVGRNLNAREFGAGSSFMEVHLVGQGGERYPARILSFNPYAVELTPEGIPPGDYGLELRNDPDGEWVTPETDQRLKVVARGDDPLGLGVSWAREFKWNRQYNPVAFGAIPDGKADCTEAFRKAIEAAKQNGGGMVFIPAGTYCAKTIQLPADVALLGADMNRSILVCIGDGSTPFISSVADGQTLGRTGVANITITALKRENWSLKKYALWLGHPWGNAVNNKEARTASRIFVVNTQSDLYAKFKFAGNLAIEAREKAILKNCRGIVPRSSYVTRYAHVLGNAFEYSTGAACMISTYCLYEDNHIMGHPEDGLEMHGFSARSKLYAFNNLHEKTGSIAHPKNDGESFLLETPGGYFDMGYVLRADGLRIEVLPSGKVDYTRLQIRQEPFAIAIVGGRGNGQFRSIRSIAGRTFTLSKPWAVVPDRTSAYSLLIPNDNLTIYGNTLLDCGATVCIYGNEYDTVVADNIIKHSGGISAGVWSMPDKARGNPGCFIRVERNLLEDIFLGKRNINNLSGVHGYYSGDYTGPAGLGFGFKANVIRGVQSDDANGIMISVAGVKGRSDYLKGILIEDNTLERVKNGIEIGRGAQGVVVKGNKIVNADRAIVGTGVESAIMIGRNDEAGKGAGWTDELNRVKLMERIP